MIELEIHIKRTSDVKPAVELIKQLKDKVTCNVKITFANTDVWSYL